MNGKKDAKHKRETELHRWKWTPEKVFHWVFASAAIGYAMWRYVTSEESTFLVKQMPNAFRKSAYGLKQKHVMVNWGWETTKYIMTERWKWYLLHPVLGQTVAHVALSGRYLASPEWMRRVQALLGSPHFLLTILASLFHLGELEKILIIFKRVVTGFPFPLVPLFLGRNSLCNVALDVAEREALSKKKRHSS